MKTTPIPQTTDIGTFASCLFKSMEAQLAEVNMPATDEMVALSRAIEIINTSLKALRDFVHQYTFQNVAEEVNFFKKTKPVFVSQLYYHQRLLAIKLNEPCQHQRLKERYYQKEILNVQEFIKDNQELYLYIITNKSHLDDKYFLRACSITSAIEDEKFNTGYDNKVAMIMAHQLLREYLLSSLQKLQSGDSISIAPITWTASKVALIELLYALHCSGTFNNGKSDIKQIASCFENLFRISLGNYYRVFQDIRMRKTGRTTFLDQLKGELTQHLNEME